MLLYITIGVLFLYTVLLIVFFLGGCTIFSTRCHPRRGIPFSRVKSPRRNTKFIEIDSVSSRSPLTSTQAACFSQSLDGLKNIPKSLLVKRASREEPAPPLKVSAPQNDYLHPKYSLPPIEIDPAQRQKEYELLRYPGRALRVDELPSYTRVMHEILLF